MEHDTPKSRPFLVTFGILLAALALSAAMLVYTSIRADAQQAPLCAPASALLSQFAEIHKEQVVWEAVVPHESGPIEIVLMQSQKSTWTLVTIRGGIACIIAAGTNATPIQTGKGV